MSEETVHLDISIEIDHREVVDTGITVAAWNAMTADERSDVKADPWTELAENDNGGISVVTDGAEGM